MDGWLFFINDNWGRAFKPNNAKQIRSYYVDNYSVLPFYYILRKIPAYLFIRAYLFIKFDGKVQPTRLLEHTLLLER